MCTDEAPAFQLVREFVIDRTGKFLSVGQYEGALAGVVVATLDVASYPPYGLGKWQSWNIGHGLAPVSSGVIIQ